MNLYEEKKEEKLLFSYASKVNKNILLYSFHYLFHFNIRSDWGPNITLTPLILKLKNRDEKFYARKLVDKESNIF